MYHIVYSSIHAYSFCRYVITVPRLWYTYSTTIGGKLNATKPGPSSIPHTPQARTHVCIVESSKIRMRNFILSRISCCSNRFSINYTRGQRLQTVKITMIVMMMIMIIISIFRRDRLSLRGWESFFSLDRPPSCYTCAPDCSIQQEILCFRNSDRNKYDRAYVCTPNRDFCGSYIIMRFF